MSLLAQQLATLMAILPKLSAKQQAQIEALLSEGTLHQGPLWAGHMTADISPASQLGKLLATAHHGNLLSPELYPQLVDIEQQLLKWFCQHFQQSHGYFTHGSSYANLEALWQARDRADTDSKLVYGSQDVHYSIVKACQILGLNFHAIACNDRGEMDEVALQQACEQYAPLAIVATAGTSSTGAVDPLNACFEIAEQCHAWCHIDAAWGGGLALLNQLPDLSCAHSICVDPHKAFAQARPCSVVLYQQALQGLDIATNYLSQTPKKTLAGSYGGELFLPLWCSLLLSGEKGLIQQIQSRLEQAELFYTLIKQNTDWWCLHSITGIVCFRPEQALANHEQLLQQGLLSETKFNDQTVYRAVFATDLCQATSLFATISKQ